MAASTFPTHLLVNDTGSAASPNGDGTLLSNAQFQSIFTDLNSMFAGAGAYSTFTLGGKLAVEGFGIHPFSAGGTGANSLRVRNTTAGTGNYSEFALGNDSNAALGYILAFSSTYTPTAAYFANGLTLEVNGAGGLSLSTYSNSSDMRFYTHSGTRRMTLFDSGGLSLGDTTDPGATNFRVAGASTLNGYVTSENGFVVNTGATNYVGIGTTGMLLYGGSYGAGEHGAFVKVGANYSGGGAPGYLQLMKKDFAEKDIWIDTANDVRTGAAPVEGASDTGGTVIGTQSSTRASKMIEGLFTDYAGALDLICRTPLYRFQYKNGAYNHSRFVGIVAEDSPEFAMDEGRSFSPVSACGYLIAGVQALTARVRALESAS